MLLPAVEVPHEVDFPGVGGPHPEEIALCPILISGVGAQKILEMGLAALEEAIQDSAVRALRVRWHKMTSRGIW